MYVLINPGPREEMVQCAHTTWNLIGKIATLELFGIPTPKTPTPGTKSVVELGGKPALGVAVSVNTARRVILIPRDAREIRLLSDTGGIIRRYYYDEEMKLPVDEGDVPAEAWLEEAARAAANPQPEKAEKEVANAV